MTKEAKKEILHTFLLVDKIRKVLENNADSYFTGNQDRINEFCELLEQYQNAVIQVGTSLEHCVKESDRGNVISKLEEYCEAIYQISNNLDNKENYRKASIVLREQHRDITDIIEKLPVRKLALFLPYKFSMWDCMESVYLAVKEDPDWDAVLLPIPYKECEEDSDEEKWIYEGPSFYDGLDAVDFREFNYAEQKPDVAYIHNPYDNMNRVTAVAPDYHSYNLKEHCGKIVYMPYFFTNSEFPGIHRDLPTYENYDYIVVASEKAKSQLAEHIGAEKVIALGSPKTDCMINMQNNYTLPTEWENRIRGRKVVLYNVSLNSILQNGFQTILKMNYVFDYFKTHHDVVLWWRPHPLMKSTLKTMRPELLGAYEAMEKKFLLEKIGIYDLDSDSNRAIAATDAFVGDYSSMCGLYGIVGKPIFLLDTISMSEPTIEDRRRAGLVFPICTEKGFIEKDGCIFCYVPNYRALCLLNIDDFSLSVVQLFDIEYYKLQAFNESNPEKTEIYLFPTDRNQKTMVYKVSDGSVREEDIFVNISTARYGLVLDLGNEWLVCPREETQALFINKSTREIYETQNYNRDLFEFCEQTGDPLLSWWDAKIGDKIYILANNVGKFLVVDLKTKISELVDIGDASERYNTAVKVNEVFYLFRWDGSGITIFDENNNIVKKIEEFPDGYLPLNSVMCNRGTPATLAAVKKKKDILTIPFLANMMLKINTENNSVEQYVIDLPYEEGQRAASYFDERNNYLSLVMYDSKYLLLQTAYDKRLIKINIDNDEVQSGEVLIPEELYQKNRVMVESLASRDRNQSPYYIRENGLTCTLNDMVEFIKDMSGWDPQKQHDASSEGVINADGTCGKAVHEYIKAHI